MSEIRNALWRIFPDGPRRSARLCSHACLEIIPASARDRLLRFRNLRGVFSENVQQDDELLRATVQNPIELAPMMAAKFTELPFDLRAVREWEVGSLIRQFVEQLDRVGNGGALRYG